MKIKVTQENIDQGDRGNSFCCAVALAICDMTGVENVSVDYDLVHFQAGDTLRALTPNKRMKAWLRNFDNYGQVEPTTFILKDRA